MEMIRGLRATAARDDSGHRDEILSTPLDLGSAPDKPEVLLASVVAAVLGRYLSCDEVVLGLQVDNAECFVGVPVSVPLDRTFGQVVDQVDRSLVNKADLRPAHTSSPAGDQLLAHALVCAPGLLETGAGGPWRLLPHNVDFDLGNVDCAFAWGPKGEAAELTLCFDANLLEAARMKVLLASVAEAAGAAAQSQAKNESVVISQLPLVSASMRETILKDFNDTRGPLSNDETVVDLIESQIVARPDNMACKFEDLSLTYAELGTRAEQLASALKKEGTRKGDTVGVLVGNSLELPIAILACLKLGAIFIPMDEMWPAERLEGLLRDTEPKAIIVTESTRVPEGNQVRLVRCDGISHEPPCGEAREEILQTDLVYGIPTSGSTGPPKCALNLHRGLINRLQYMTRRYSSGPDEVVLQNSRPAFDSSLWQLLWPLTNGATVVIPRPSKQLDLNHTIALIQRHQVTMTDFVPSVFNTLVRQLEQDSGDVARLTSLRNLLIGGEEINPEYCRRFTALLPNAGLTNTYGPSEASIGMVFHEVTAADGDNIPIGRPIDNTHAVVLDEEMRLVPPGMVGELYIGGVCLGAGYLRDPERTAQAWVPNPFDDLDGNQLYRTGDSVHQAPDGKLYFIGRSDGQVKIGGIRVELGEIEHLLVQRPDVDRAIVCAEETTGGNRLVAYLVSTNGASPAELKAHLLDRLPKHVVPSRFVFLDELPLTHNGKLDRKRLAAAADSATAGAVGKSPTEVGLCAIWKDLLGRDDFNLDDDFFLLGGDSLLVVHLVFDIADRLGPRIPLRTVYEAPTIRQLAAIVSGEEPAVQMTAQDDDIGLAESDRRQLLADLPDAITAPRTKFIGKRVLVTGATGFVGAHVVAKLMERMDVQVLFLARDGDESRASERLQSIMTSYGLWDATFPERLQPVPGNLELDGLGLPAAELNALAHKVDAVVNCAGMVDFLHDYGRHRPVNVEGLAQILRLAAQRGPERLHHISSISAGDPNHLPADGYGLSKWVAERLAEQAAAHGYDVTVHRLGEVMPHSRTGSPNTRSLSYLFIRSCLVLGIYPEDLVTLDYSPADWVAEAIVDSIFDPRSEESVLNLFHPVGTTLDEIMASANDNGFEVTPVTGPDFYRGLESRCELDGDRSLHSLGCLIAAALQEQAAQDDIDLALSNLFIGPAGSGENGSAGSFIGRGPVRWPEIDKDLLYPMLAETGPRSRSRAYSS